MAWRADGHRCGFDSRTPTIGAWQGRVRRGAARSGLALLGSARLGSAGRGVAVMVVGRVRLPATARTWLGSARFVRAGIGEAWQGRDHTRPKEGQ